MLLLPKFRRSTHAMKQLYNRIYRIYGIFEKSLDPKIESIVQKKIAVVSNLSTCAALEYACGSGLLSLKLAPLFKSVSSRDISIKMLERAKIRAKYKGYAVHFSEGNLLAIDEQDKSFDYVFISCALHLFPPDVEEEILKKLCTVAKKAVIIIDHGRKWSFSAAVVEWFEGSFYDQFIKIDFKSLAERIGCKTFEEEQIENVTVLSFFV